MIKATKIFMLLLTSFILVSLSGCNSFRNDLPREIIYDTIYVRINNNGDLEKAIAGERPVKAITFYKAGQSISFKKGDIVKIESDGIDFSRITFKVDYSDNNDSVTIKTVKIQDAEVKLSSKCETIVWNDPDYLPAVRVSESLKPEQIVITPIFNSKCEKVGYQIRYGSIQRDCYEQGIEILKQFDKCVKKNKKKKPRTKLIDVLF